MKQRIKENHESQDFVRVVDYTPTIFKLLGLKQNPIWRVLMATRTDGSSVDTFLNQVNIIDLTTNTMNSNSYHFVQAHIELPSNQFNYVGFDNNKNNILRVSSSGTESHSETLEEANKFSQNENSRLENQSTSNSSIFNALNLLHQNSPLDGENEDESNETERRDTFSVQIDENIMDSSENVNQENLYSVFMKQ